MEASIIIVLLLVYLLIRLHYISIFARDWNYLTYKYLYSQYLSTSVYGIRLLNENYEKICLTPNQVLTLVFCVWKLTSKSLVSNKPHHTEILELWNAK